MIAPTFTETLLPNQARARLMQLRAVYIAKHSKPGRQVYWVQPKNTWILVSPRGQALVLGYYQMKRCPCEDE